MVSFSVDNNEHTDVYKVTLEVQIERLNDFEGTYSTYTALFHLISGIMNLIAAPEREGIRIKLVDTKRKGTYVTIPIHGRNESK